jgi:hypothetical protein
VYAIMPELSALLELAPGCFKTPPAYTQLVSYDTEQLQPPSSAANNYGTAASAAGLHPTSNNSLSQSLQAGHISYIS